MSNLKRLRRKRAAQKKANIRRMAVQHELRQTLGPGKLLKRMSRDHLDILQNIEFVLVSAYREDDSIDDRIVADALKAAIRDEAPQNARSRSLNEGLAQMRDLRTDVPDDIWRAGLQTVLQSVHRHSSLRPGERNYLDFASDFIP